MYETVILAGFEATLLETKYIVCKIANMLSLNIKNCAFRGPHKTHPSGMSEIAVPELPKQVFKKADRNVSYMYW